VTLRNFGLSFSRRSARADCWRLVAPRAWCRRDSGARRWEIGGMGNKSPRERGL